MFFIDDTHQQLVDQVISVRDDIDALTLESVEEWVGQQLGVDAVTRDAYGQLLGIEITVACGGPTITVCTRYNTIEGRWGNDTISYFYKSEVLDEYVTILYG